MTNLTELRRWLGGAMDPHGNAEALLGDALELIKLAGGALVADPEHGEIGIELPDDAEVPQWAVEAFVVYFDLLVAHWRQSPTAILVCDVCGEVRLVGGKKSKKCTRGSAKKLDPLAVTPRFCSGRQLPVDVPWKNPRPRAKKTKIDNNKEKP